MARLKDKLAVVTGGARGIGRGICEAFFREGAEVILTDIDVEEGQAAARAIGCRFHKLDVTEEVDWETLARIAPAIDVMVNNAGITGFEDGPGPHDPAQAIEHFAQAVLPLRRIFALLTGT